jgi:hypothetical protein
MWQRCKSDWLISGLLLLALLIFALAAAGIGLP